MSNIFGFFLICSLLLTISCGKAPDEEATTTATPTGSTAYVPPSFSSNYCNINNVQVITFASGNKYTCLSDDNTETVYVNIEANKDMRLQGYTRIPGTTSLSIQASTINCQWTGTSYAAVEYDFTFYEVKMDQTHYLMSFKDKRGTPFRCVH